MSKQIVSLFKQQQLITTAMNSKIEDGDDVEMIIKTQKESQTGWFSNQRLLLIKAGIVSYFSSIPKQFSGSYRAIELSKQIPKFTIPADQISKVELQGDQLSFLILKERLIARDDFDKMVKGDNKLLNQRASRIVTAEGAGYEQWIFKCSNKEQLEEFYRLVHLFRMGHPKFQPNLNTIVESYQNKPKPRKQTIDPSKNTVQPPPKRNSEVPKINNQLAKEEPKAQPEPEKPIPPEDDPIPFTLEPDPQFIDSQHIKQRQQERLLAVVDKLAASNEPILDSISEKTQEYKNSELSKMTTERPIVVDVINTFEESKESIEEYIKQELPEVQEKKAQEQQQEQKVQEEQNKWSQQSQPEQQKEQQKIEKKKYFSPSHVQSRVSFEVRQKKVRKINQLLKAASMSSQHDLKAMAKQLGISQQKLQQFLNVNLMEEESSWNFIENQLGKLLSKGSPEDKDMEQTNEVIKTVSYGLIPEYNKLHSFLDASKLKSGQLLEGELSFDNYPTDNSQQFQLLQWIQTKVSQNNPRPFSSISISQKHYNIHTKAISFAPQDILVVKGSWVIGRNSPLEEFLAYLSLEKMVKEVNAKLVRSGMVLECGEAIYLKFKEHEAMVKQLKVGNSLLPIRSIRALEIISKSRDMLKFQQDFPQFIVTVENIKQGQSYRLHLNRPTQKNTTSNIPSLLRQLQKLTFPFDNELDLFFQSQQYSNLQTRCIQTLYSLQQEHVRISEERLFDIFAIAESNLEVDTICKIMGARIDKNNNLLFHPTVLRLGNRQFGQELALIRKARKKGQFQFSQQLSKTVMSRLQYYKQVTPVSNFIQIYLQLIDLLIIEKGQLHRAVPVLLKVVSYLSQYQIQQYPVYLALMKTYLKLNQINNFVKVLENCRLFLGRMFHQRALLFDFPFVRVLAILAMNEGLKNGLEMTDLLIGAVKVNNVINAEIRNKYMSKAVWDRCNILILLEDYEKAYKQCEEQLSILQKLEDGIHCHWVQGVLCLAKCWLEIQQTNIKSCAIVQKRLQKAIELSLARENFQTAFMLLQTGSKLINKCKQLKLPRILQSLPAFQQAKIQYNSTKQQMLGLIEQSYDEQEVS